MTILSMMRIKVALCLIIVMAVGCPSWAVNGTPESKWAFVGFTRYRDALFIDMNRITHDMDQRTRVWSRMTPAKHSKYYRQIQRDLRKVDKPAMEFRYMETLNEISCRDRRIRFEKVLYYRQDGEVIHATRDDNAQWKTITPGSLWESLGAIVCDK